jgi:hypothetical protein
LRWTPEFTPTSPLVRSGKDLLMRTVLVKGSDELRRIFREGGRAIASNDTGGGSAYAPLSPTEALVLDVEGFLNDGGCIADIKPIFGHGSLVSQARGCVGCGPFGCSVQDMRGAWAAFARPTSFAVVASGDSVSGGTRVPPGAHAPHGAPR